MTVQTVQGGALALAAPAAVNLPNLPAEMAAIVQWANTASAAQKLVEMIVDTPFMPAAFWPKFDTRDREAAQHARQQAIASGTAAVLYGGPLGLNPLQSLANIHVVKGKPGLPAELMVALVRSHGHEVGIEDLTDHRCRVWGRRAGSDEVHRAEFSMDRAKKAGYTSQNAKYGTDPQAMLYARAVSVLCRQMAPEVLKGLSTVEDLTDEPDADAPAKGTRTVKRAEVSAVGALGLASAAAPVARAPQAEARAAAQGMRTAPPSGHVASEAQSGPPLPGEEESAPEHAEPESQAAPEAVGGITEGQKRKLGEAYAILDVTGTGQRIRRAVIAGHILGKPCGSVLDLTEAEAEEVLARLTIIARLQPSERAMVVASMEEGRGQAEPTPAPEPAAAEAEPVAEPVAEYDPTVGGDPWANVPDGGEQG